MRAEESNALANELEEQSVMISTTIDLARIAAHYFEICLLSAILACDAARAHRRSCLRVRGEG